MLQKTSVDWFAFRSKDTPDVFASALQDGLPSHLSVDLKPRKTGWRAFEKSMEIWVTDKRAGDPNATMKCGMMMTGGANVRGWSMASLDGGGCSWVSDWSKLMDVCTDDLDAFELKRVDLALDRFDGSRWEEVDQAWKDGKFNPPGSGRPPKAKPIDSRRPQDGRTYYVGSRTSSKFYRGYEKGLQLLGPELAALELKGASREDIEGAFLRTEAHVVRTDHGPEFVSAPIFNWWRDEVEFKPVNGPLPLDLVDRRDQYFAGAYPYLAEVLPNAQGEALVQRRERMPQLEVTKALAHIQRQFGRTLYTACAVYGGDINAVWDRIVGEDHNPALIAAGVLMGQA